MTSAIATGHSRLERLREDTRFEHVAIEAALGLAKADLTLANYRRVLERFHGFYAPLEEDLREIGGWSEYGLDLEARSKTPLLRIDLLALGVDPAALAICAGSDRPRPRTRAEGFGVLYVLEGATLGGQILGRHVARTLGLTPETGARFFHGYGARTGEMWRAFRNALGACPLAAGDEDAMVRAAIDTFRSLRAWCRRRE